MLPLRSFAICLLGAWLLPASSIASEGIDYSTGGDWNTSTTAKPWSIDGQNIYGTAGYHFFNTTPIGGKSRSNRPVEENLRSALPEYVKSITPAAGAVTAHSYGYLAIDAPWRPDGAKAESGLLVKTVENSNPTVELLTIDLGKIQNIYGFRLGILIANSDRAEITPRDVELSTSDKSWSRSVINIPSSKDGVWVFFNVSKRLANKQLVLSIKAHVGQPAAIGGLVFEDLTVTPPEQPLNVASEQAVSQFGSVVWDASLEAVAPAQFSDNWEHLLAMKLSEDYRQNEARLKEIHSELKQLPVPYSGEPTGSGGYLSHWVGSGKNDIVLNFQWEEAVEIDAVALFPLRLFLADETGLIDNAYWSNNIRIHAIDRDEPILLGEIDNRGQKIRKSLPALATFEPCVTSHIKITLSDLSRKLGSYQFAGGFSEICVFSKQENVAPRAQIKASRSREGYRVFSKDYLTDGQTPLGLPELGPRTTGSLGLSLRRANRIPNAPAKIRIDFEEEILIDAVRIDPAVIYKPGQAFPVRFSIELLDASNQIIRSDITFQHSPLRSPGLNPFFSYFPETLAKAVRIQIYEISKPTIQSRPWVQISEITPMHKGSHIRQKATVTAEETAKKFGGTILYDPSGMRLYWQNEFVYDGQTQSGRVLPLREWILGLAKLQDLLEEELALKTVQEETLHDFRVRTVWSVCLLIALIILIALYLIIQSKVNTRRELRNARELIASDLHDDVGSNLGSITLHTEFLMEQVEEDNQRDHLQAITQLARESVYGLREVLHTTAPRIGRAQNILHYMEELSQLVLPDVELQMDLDPTSNRALRSLERRKGILLYYKEAITNIRTHAKCQTVSISMQKVDRTLNLVIEDDGIGMTADKLSQESTLRTLKLRAEQLNASLSIISKVDQGTRLELKIPLKKHALT